MLVFPRPQNNPLLRLPHFQRTKMEEENRARPNTAGKGRRLTRTTSGIPPEIRPGACKLAFASRPGRPGRRGRLPPQQEDAIGQIALANLRRVGLPQAAEQPPPAPPPFSKNKNGGGKPRPTEHFWQRTPAYPHHLGHPPRDPSGSVLGGPGRQAPVLAMRCTYPRGNGALPTHPTRVQRPAGVRQGRAPPGLRTHFIQAGLRQHEQRGA
jgi:hypothetical protein